MSPSFSFSDLGGGSSTGSERSSEDPHALEAAAVFLALHIGTGLTAALGAYVTRNPLRAAYTTAVRAHRKASERAVTSASRLADAAAERNRHAMELRAAEEIRDEAERSRLALAEQLKQLARLSIARHAQDPAVTDAIFRPDARPYDWRGQPSSRN